jgi:hypothetical protein
MPQIDLAFEVGEQKRDLGSVGNGWFHCRGLQGFRGQRQVLPAIQHSKNHAYYIT